MPLGKREVLGKGCLVGGNYSPSKEKRGEITEESGEGWMQAGSNIGPMEPDLRCRGVGLNPDRGLAAIRLAGGVVVAGLAHGASHMEEMVLLKRTLWEYSPRDRHLWNPENGSKCADVLGLKNPTDSKYWWEKHILCY